MRILALSAQIPYPPHHGKAMRDYHLLTGLARGHHVHLLCMVGDAAEIAAAGPLAELVPFDAVPRPRHGRFRRLAALLLSGRPDLFWRTWSRPLRQLLAARLSQLLPDILLVEGLEMAGYGLWARDQMRRSGAPSPLLILDEHNAEFLLQRRAWEIGRSTMRTWPAAWYSWLQARRLARFETTACHRADHVVAVSPDDAAALRRIAPRARVSVVPNGVDTTDYAPLPPRSDSAEPVLVFTGRMDFRPNVDAVQWFCNEVWPSIRARFPEARFQIVGRDPTAAVRALGQAPGVEVVGPVPDDRPYIGLADVYVLPMRFGGGIRFKLLQALSMARPVVSTSLGAEGVVGLVDGEHLLLAEAGRQMAEKTVELLRSAALRDRLGRAGRDLVVAHYDWAVLLPRLEAVLSEAGRQGA